MRNFYEKNCKISKRGLRAPPNGFQKKIPPLTSMASSYTKISEIFNSFMLCVKWS